MTLVPTEINNKKSHGKSWKEAPTSLLTVIYRTMLCNITEEHTSISLQVNLNSKLQIALDVIKIKIKHQPFTLLKLTSDLSVLSRNVKTQYYLLKKVKNNLHYTLQSLLLNRQERKCSFYNVSDH